MKKNNQKIHKNSSKKNVKEDAHKEDANAEKENNVVVSEKDKLLELYKTLKDLGINSIGDLEVRISRL
ncbi:MAG: hypothetical protein WCX88_02100 [Patescibacteria group bacterium]